MLAYLSAEGSGAADLVLAEVARRLIAAGWPLAGAVQVNRDMAPGQKCQMDLHVLATDRVFRISQDLGALSKGCRLDPAGLEAAVGHAEASLGRGPRLVIVNKFGKQEIDGRGFRPLVGEALGRGIPVLTAVGAGNLAAFERFAGGMATRLPPDAEAAIAWARQTVAAAALLGSPVS